MTKAVAKAKTSKDTDNTGGISWIPSGPVESSKKKTRSEYINYT